MLATEQREAVERRVKRLCGQWHRWNKPWLSSLGVCVLPEGHDRLHVLEFATHLSPWQRARLEHFRQR